jgi:uncharacterized protein with von Willebrand factor type A (vWA) domain
MGDAMNERLKELAVQAGLKIEEDGEAWVFMTHISFFEKFAELVLQNYASQIMTTEEREQFIREDEREANAKLLEEMGEKQTNQSLLDPWDCAAAIRARGEI